MILPEIVGLDGFGAGITGTNIYLYRKRIKERRDRNRTAETRNKDSRTGQNAKGGADIRTGTEERTGTRLETIRQVDPIRAWKSVALMGDNHTVFMTSHHTQGAIELEQRAKCTETYYRYGLSERPAHGTVPEPNCSCGWYAIGDRAQLAAMGYDSLAIAEVDLYGTVIECEFGYRAEYQRIMALLIRRDYCRGGFLCDRPPEVLDFRWTERQHYHGNGHTSTVKERHPVAVCGAHVEDTAVDLSQVAGRLGVEVRWAE